MAPNLLDILKHHIPLTTTPPPKPIPDDCAMHQAFYNQLDSCDLINLNTNLKTLLHIKRFSHPLQRDAAKWLTSDLLPCLFGQQLHGSDIAPLPPPYLMQSVQQLLHSYGHPEKHPVATLPKSIGNGKKVPASIDSGSAGLSESYKEMMSHTRPEDIPMKWGLGGDALFRCPSEEEDEEDVLMPGKTYAVRSGDEHWKEVERTSLHETKCHQKGIEEVLVQESWADNNGNFEEASLQKSLVDKDGEFEEDYSLENQNESEVITSDDDDRSSIAYSKVSLSQTHSSQNEGCGRAETKLHTRPASTPPVLVHGH